MNHNAYQCQLGRTPLVPVQLSPDAPTVWCKLEFLIPAVRLKIELPILGKAMRCGSLQAGGSVVEASSGSTSIAMALACAQLGLKFTAIMPANVSRERILMIEAYGAAIELTPPDEGIEAAIHSAKRHADAGSFWPQQFTNQDNVEAHRRWTAGEIINQIPSGQVDAVVAGVGTGGSLVGIHAGVCDNGCPSTPVLAKPVTAAIGDIECCSFSNRVPGVMNGISSLFDPAMSQLITIEVADDVAIETTRQLIRMGYPIDGLA